MQDKDAFIEDEQIDIPIPSHNEALRAVELLQKYQDKQETATAGDIRYLDRLERSIRLVKSNNCRQTTLGGWIT